MLQSSITAWLKKPASITKVDTPTPIKSEAAVPEASRPEQSEQASIKSGNRSSSPCTPHLKSSISTSSNAFILPPLPPNVEFVPLTEDLIPGFKRLNSLTLPVPYPKAYYTESMTEPYHSLTLVALWHPSRPAGVVSMDSDKPHLVGAIRCRLLPSSILYISTLCLLAPYRSHGIATHLLQRISAKAAKEHQVKTVAAHVWEANEDGLEWYKKRGFKMMGKEEGYYSKLRPSGAMLVQKVIGVGDLLGSLEGSLGSHR